jgi:hypothetical protein
MNAPRQQQQRWMWCLHCEQVWPYEGELPSRCKTPDCDGGIFDISDYQRNGWHPRPDHWPPAVTLTPGQEVPLYPKRGG